MRQPDEAAGRPHDRGGNILRYTATQGLHGYWDVNLVEVIDSSRNNAQLESMLREAVQASSWRTSGQRERWAAKWAADAVVEARGAYKDIEFLSAQFDQSSSLTNIYIKLPQEYQATQTARAKTQLSKSAFHLAELLNRLDWE
jgi:hypothetical protein